MASIPEFFLFFFTKSSTRLLEGKEISILANSELGLECVEVPEMIQGTKGGGLLLVEEATLLLYDYSLSPSTVNNFLNGSGTIIEVQRTGPDRELAPVIDDG